MVPGQAEATSSGHAESADGVQAGVSLPFRSIPVYIRLVPKDIWIRMHVDSRATIGSVKDAVMERVHFPPHDPSMNPYFYDDARSAMSRQSASANEVKSLPKAFLARMPKRSMRDIVRAEQEADSVSIFSSKTNKSNRSGIQSRKIPTVKTVPTSAQARAILGGEAGVGGRGSMGFVSMRSQSTNDDAPHSALNTPSQYSTPDFRNDIFRSQSSSPSPSPYRRSSGGTATGQTGKSSILRQTSKLSTNSSSGREGKSSGGSGEGNRIGADSSSDSVAARKRSLTEADSLDLTEGWEGIMLSGNEEAKRLEEAAMLNVKAAEARMAASPFLDNDPHGSSNDCESADTHSTSHDHAGSANPASDEGVDAYDVQRGKQIDNGLEGMQEDDPEFAETQDDSDDDEVDNRYAELVSRSGRMSVQSASSSNVSLEDVVKSTAVVSSSTKQVLLPDDVGSEAKSNAKQADSAVRVPDLRSPSPASSRGERARSGTIMPGDVNRKAAFIAAAEAGYQGVDTPSTINTTSSVDANVPDSDILQLPASNLPLQPTANTGGLDTSHPLLRAQDRQGEEGDRSLTSTPSHLGDRPIVASSSLGAQPSRRLAGIFTDEISSWRDAQHHQARFFSVYSYSNGHVLEDWRTVAAFHIRPYELLEIQFADPRERVHLPRIGEATNLISRRHMPKMDKDDENASFGLGLPFSTRSSQNPALDSQYLEPYGECWCYVFKRGSGTSRTQRAGLGLWKLRWICLHSNRLFIFRTKPARYAFDEAISVWNLDGIDAVLSERADGATRPLLLPLTGQCQDILTLSFRLSSITGSSIAEENHDEVHQPTVSIRFITQLDHCAFFRSCSRAHYRASLRRTDVYQASRVYEWRWKALARGTIAGMGGTVIPGKAARRGGRNSLARIRLRPSGIKRDFDDADRWSSDSETEDFRVPSSGNEEESVDRFFYSDALITSSQIDVPGVSFTPLPSVPSMSYFNNANSAAASDSASHLQSGHLMPRNLSVSTATEGSPASGAARRASGPTRSTLSQTNSPLRSRVTSTSSSLHRPLESSSGSQLLSPDGIGLGVISDGPLSPLDRSHREPMPSRPFSSTGIERRRESTPLHSSRVAPPTTTLEAQSEAAPDVSNAQSSSNTESDQRPIFSPSADDEEESPAAQAIHSFLAQRSASTRSNLNRSRSTTIAVSPSAEVGSGFGGGPQQLSATPASDQFNFAASPARRRSHYGLRAPMSADGNQRVSPSGSANEQSAASSPTPTSAATAAAAMGTTASNPHSPLRKIFRKGGGGSES